MNSLLHTYILKLIVIVECLMAEFERSWRLRKRMGIVLVTLLLAIVSAFVLGWIGVLWAILFGLALAFVAEL